MEPEVTVLVPVYNRERYIETCLRSLFNQKTSIKFEVICIDDGSTDMTFNILSKYSDRITVVQNRENQGLPYSLNLGIQKSKGRYLVRVDSDDYVSNNFIELLYYTIVSNPKFDAVACDYITFGEKHDERITESHKNPIACGIIFKKESLIALGGYNEEFLSHEDKEFRSRFDEKYEVIRLPIPLYRYRLHSDSITGNEEMSAYYLELLSKLGNE
jgi:glycosyltransferase involved in cell wall biosynthesis